MVFKLFSWGDAKKEGITVSAGDTRAQADGAEAQQGHDAGRFGVKSYLGTFYASPSEEHKGWYLLPPPRQSAGLAAFRITCVVSLVMFLSGAGLLAYGYLCPPDIDVETELRKLDAHVDAEGNVWLTRDALERFGTDQFHIFKVVGIMLFATGGIVLAGAMMVMSCCDVCEYRQRCPTDVALSPADQQQQQGAAAKPGKTHAGPSPIPAASSVAKVQPANKDGQQQQQAGDKATAKGGSGAKRDSPSTSDQVLMDEGEKSAI